MPTCARRTLLTFLIWLPVIGAVDAAPTSTAQKYDFVVQDFVAGSMTRKARGNAVDVVYSYRDNGRGPDVKERWTFASNGSVASYAAKGKTTFDATIDERFQQQAGRASWKTLSDAGETAAPAPLFYVPIQGTPEAFAVLARELLAVPTGRLPLAPSGEAAITKVETLTVNAGGAPRSVSLYAIAGLELSPTYVWLDDGPDRDLFASLYPGPYGLIAQGYAGEAKRLGERQQAADGTLLADLQRKTRHTVAGNAGDHQRACVRHAQGDPRRAEHGLPVPRQGGGSDAGREAGGKGSHGGRRGRPDVAAGADRCARPRV